MGQKQISKKELKCIDSHLCYAVKAIIRDSRSGDGPIRTEQYDVKSRKICRLLFDALMLVDKLNE